MANVAVHKVEDQTSKTLPVYEEIQKRFEDVQRRAFELFEKRGHESGHSLEDWLTAEREVFGWPAAEMAEKDKEYELQLMLPGFDAKDVQVTATPSEIVVYAETKLKEKIELANVLWTEFALNDIYRKFEMPQRIDADMTEATLDKGVLRITAKKATTAEQKPIAVATA